MGPSGRGTRAGGAGRHAPLGVPGWPHFPGHRWAGTAVAGDARLCATPAPASRRPGTAGPVRSALPGGPSAPLRPGTEARTSTPAPGELATQGLAGSWVPSPIPRASCVLGDPRPLPSTPEWLSFLPGSSCLPPAHLSPSPLLPLGAFFPQMKWGGASGTSLEWRGMTPSVLPPVWPPDLGCGWLCRNPQGGKASPEHSAPTPWEDPVLGHIPVPAPERIQSSSRKSWDPMENCRPWGSAFTRPGCLPPSQPVLRPLRAAPPGSCLTTLQSVSPVSPLLALRAISLLGWPCEATLFWPAPRPPTGVPSSYVSTGEYTAGGLATSRV